MANGLAARRTITDSLGQAYRAETQQLMARRVPMAVLIFLSSIGGASALEWVYHPQRTGPILMAYAAHVLTCLAQLVAVQRAPARSVTATVLATNVLALAMSAYFGTVHGSAEVLVLLLLLFLTGLVILYPWGLRGQVFGSLGALAGYPLALAAGAAPGVPAPYDPLALLAAVCLTALGAYLFDAHRLSIFRQAIALRRANAEQQQEHEFSAALLRVGRALNATITDPGALVEQLTELTRLALGANWAFLYQREEDAPSFRIAAVSNAPDIIAEELRALDFYPAGAPTMYDRLERMGTLELVGREEQEFGFGFLLQRWNLTAALLQAVRRNERVIGILGCCYTGRAEGIGERQHRLLAAIANQASVALENARLIEDVRAADHIKSEFVATVSHELRTPLNVILGYTDLLLEGAFDPPTANQLDTLQRIHQQSIQLLDLIQAMLTLNRLEARALPLEVEPFSVGELFTSLRVSLPASWCGGGVHVSWNAADERAVVHTDRRKVEMILRNLIHNALKYTEQGTVTISAQRQLHEPGMCFTVADTGPGIASEDLATIFEMFRQGTARPPRGGGVGLGLYIVKRLTEALGGDVTVESPPSSGARFSVSLPAQPPRWTPPG